MLLIAAAALLGACDVPVSPAEPIGYAFALPLDTPVVYRWPEGSVVRIHPAVVGDPVRDGMLSDALSHAVADWQAVVGPDVLRLVVTERVEAADVVVRWSDVAAPVSTAGCEPVVEGSAATTFCRAADGQGIEPFPLLDGRDVGTVRMLVTVLAQEATGRDRVRQLVAHELGHVLGIGRHSSDPADLMWDGPLRRSRPSSADGATLRRLYETSPDLVP